MTDPSRKTGRAEPGVAVIPFINARGLATLYVKEVRRFFKVQLQTVWAPAITTLLFLAIFTLALGGGAAARVDVMSVPFHDFLAPGLIVMGMIQNAFANSSSSVLIGKLQGTIIDVLMPPLSSGELVLSYVAGAVTRGWLVGLAIWAAMLLWPDLHVVPHHPLAILYFGTMGCVMLSLLGVLTGVWAEKFDHAAAVTNFIVQPLSLLSGTFYTVDRLHGVWHTLSGANPFHWVISGFRYGFLGQADVDVLRGGLMLLAVDVFLWALCYQILRSGWRLRA